MTAQNPTTGAGDIKKFVITSNKGGKETDLSAAVVDYRYYESVLANNITASATVIETGNDLNGPAKSTIDGLPLRGGEKCEIVIVDAQDQELKLDNGLYVNRVRGADPGTLQDLYQIDFASEEFFLNENTRVTKRYEGKVSDNVKEILTEVLGSQDNIEIDDTSTNYNFVGNTRKPFYTVTWLASKSAPNSSGKSAGAAGFLFYQTRDGLFFKSIDDIFSQESTKKFIYNDTGEPVSGYDANIISYNIDSDVDLNQNMNVGTYKNKAYYFDQMNMCFKTIDFSIENQKGSAKTAGNDYINVNEKFIQKPSRHFSYIKDIGTNPKGTGDQQLETWKSDPTKQNFESEQSMVQTFMRYNQLFTVQINILIPGDFSIKAGDIIECEFPQLISEVTKEGNQQSGGIYMVGSVCHRVTPRETFTSLGLIRDSFGKKGGLGF